MTAKLEVTQRQLLEQLAASAAKRDEQIERLLHCLQLMLKRIERMEVKLAIDARPKSGPWSDRFSDRLGKAMGGIIRAR